MKVIKVNTFNKYSVVIDNSFNSFPLSLPTFKGEKVAVILDSNINKFYGKFLDDFFKDKKIFKYIVKAGENSKNSKNFLKILNLLALDGFTRNDTIIAFGGGVVGDLSGFIASTYMRGICLISIPTSLLAMVDSSVGGKTAINLKYGKNLCGTFYQPSFVYINTGFLNTLPKKEIYNGFGEIIKYSYIKKDILLEDLQSIDYEKLIEKCLKIKVKIVEKDEKEGSFRKLLNFGHTFGHAIEKLSNFKLSHGDCVVKGIYFALKISKSYYNLDNSLIDDFINTASKFNFDYSCNYKKEEIVKQLYSDKKRNDSGVDFILCKSKGNLQIVNISMKDIGKYL